MSNENDFLLKPADAVHVERLPPEQRTLLESYVNDGKTYQQLADFHVLPMGTVKSRIHRAQAKVKLWRQHAAAVKPAGGNLPAST